MFARVLKLITTIEQLAINDWILMTNVRVLGELTSHIEVRVASNSIQVLNSINK